MPARHTTRDVRLRPWLDDLHHRFLYATSNAVRQFPLQDGLLRKMQVPDQQQMRDALTVPKNRHPVLCALAFELENLRLVVTDILEQFVLGEPSLSERQRCKVFRLIFQRAASCLSVIIG